MNINNQKWHQTQSSTDAIDFSTAFWERHRADIESGNFWADRIKEFRGEPIERLRIAIDNLPLPAAFREGAVATRSLIREKRKDKESYADQLALLYWLAAINSFLVPYSEKLQGSGYNILGAIPAQTLKSLSFTYSELGYRQLALLNKTDIKCLIELWGEPESHSTLLDKHRAVWDEYEAKCVEKSKEEKTQFLNEINAMLQDAPLLSSSDSGYADHTHNKETISSSISIEKLLLLAICLLVLTILFYI